MDLTSIRLALALFPLDLHVRTGGHQVGCCALFLLETVMRLLPGRGRLMVGPNLSQFEFLSAACELWLLGLRRVRLPVALTPHPKDPRLGKLLACFCLFTGFCTLHAWPNHWVIFGFQLQAIPVSIGPITYFPGVSRGTAVFGGFLGLDVAWHASSLKSKHRQPRTEVLDLWGKGLAWET